DSRVGRLRRSLHAHALIEGQPQQAQQALAHPAFERLGELPVDQQFGIADDQSRLHERIGMCWNDRLRQRRR
ncbi:hypothetical protein U8L64_01475, partial [Pseudomonas sp. FIP_A4]|uniref:hypothetical protein n=1 Tax=Pseudomonas sp. FIP_A4 TaxID=3070684 RepID=UPI002FD6DBF2